MNTSLTVNGQTCVMWVV